MNPLWFSVSRKGEDSRTLYNDNNTDVCDDLLRAPVAPISPFLPGSRYEDIVPEALISRIGQSLDKNKHMVGPWKQTIVDV